MYWLLDTLRSSRRMHWPLVTAIVKGGGVDVLHGVSRPAHARGESGIDLAAVSRFVINLYPLT